MITVKDLTIGSPVYCVSLDAIEIARVRLIEQFYDGSRSIELNLGWKPRCNEEEDATEIRNINSYETTTWYINIEDAKLAQTMLRSEHVEKLKKNMEMAQNAFVEAINKYAFSETSTPKEL